MTCRPGHSAKFPDFEPGNTVARRHGVWAKDASDEARQVVGLLLSEDDIERYPGAALLFATTWVRWRRAESDIDSRGEVLDGERAHPLLPVAARLRRDLLDLIGRFGLDPRSDAGLIRERAEATRSVSDLDSIRDVGRRARLAAEARGELPSGVDAQEGGL